MSKASERECLTQSALSLRIGRLEEMIERRLFIRDGSRLTLSPAGHVLLDYARRLLDLNDKAIAALSTNDFCGPIRVGIVQDFAETLLAGVLARFSHLHPSIQLEVRIISTREMLERVDNGQLDLAIGIGGADDPRAVRRAPMFWIGAGELLEQEVIPLAMIEAPCRFRDAALAALDHAGQPYRIVLETPDVSTLRAAVSAGLGITCRSDLFGAGEAIPLARLPPLPLMSCIVVTPPHPAAPIAQLGQLVREALNGNKDALTLGRWPTRAAS